MTGLKQGAQAQITDAPTESRTVPPENPRTGRDWAQDRGIPEHRCLAAL